MKLLVVEDDRALNQGIALSFGSETVVQAFCLKEAEKLNFLIASLVKTSRLENEIIAVAPKQNRVGELLRQLDQEYESCAEKKGVGIGLYLAREIVCKEGGYIKVSSEFSKGSVFSVFLPKSRNK